MEIRPNLPDFGGLNGPFRQECRQCKKKRRGGEDEDDDNEHVHT